RPRIGLAPARLDAAKTGKPRSAQAPSRTAARPRRDLPRARPARDATPAPEAEAGAVGEVPGVPSAPLERLLGGSGSTRGDRADATGRVPDGREVGPAPAATRPARPSRSAALGPASVRRDRAERRPSGAALRRRGPRLAPPCRPDDR